LSSSAKAAQPNFDDFHRADVGHYHPDAHVDEPSTGDCERPSSPGSTTTLDRQIASPIANTLPGQELAGRRGVSSRQSQYTDDRI
jgi:hypothetical protein